MGIQPEKRGARKNDMGESVFLETDPISLFWDLLIYLLLHIGMNTESPVYDPFFLISKKLIFSKGVFS